MVYIKLTGEFSGKKISMKRNSNEVKQEQDKKKERKCNEVSQ